MTDMRPYDDGTTKGGAVHPAVQPLRVMVFALMISPIILGVVLAIITADKSFALLPVLISVVVGIAVWAVLRVVGYRQEPITPEVAADPMRVLNAFRVGLMLRFALAESVALVALVTTIAFGGNIVSYLPGAVISLVLFALDVMPNRTNVARVEQQMDRAGARSGLSALFGF